MAEPLIVLSFGSQFAPSSASNVDPFDREVFVAVVGLLIEQVTTYDEGPPVERDSQLDGEEAAL